MMKRLLTGTSEGLYEIKGKQIQKLTIPGIGNNSIYCITSDKTNNIYASGENIIYKIQEDEVVNTYKFNFKKENKIFRLLADKKNYIWFSILNEGLFRFNTENNHLTDMNKKLDVEKLHVNAFYMDNKDNVWACTYGEGVYCFYNTFINNYNAKDGMINSKINSVSGDKEQRIYCGTYNGLSVLEKDSFFNVKPIGAVDIADYIRHVNKINDSLLTINYVNEQRVYYSTKYKNITLFYSPSGTAIFIKEDTLIIGTYTNGILTTLITNIIPSYTNSNLFFVVGDTFSANKINDLSMGNTGKVWIASDLGISMFYENKVRVIERNKLNSQFSSIKEDKNGFVWACGEKGLFIIEDTTLVYVFSKVGHENVTSFEFDNEGHAWLSTSQGLSGMSVLYSDGTIELREKYLLNEKAGLVSNDISSLYYDKTGNRLWAGTSSGLSSIDLNGFNEQHKEALPLRILSIGTSDSVYSFNENISFPDYTKDIRVTVSSFDINSTGNLQYNYKLNSEDTLWSSTNEHVISFPSLTYGDYDFRVYAANSFGKVSDTSSVNFTVETPFTRSYFFYSLIGLTAMVLTGFGVSRSLKKKYIIEKERSTFKTQISDLKQRSLASMMNPHFVFNSLNSIQSFYNYKENESANEYLAKFSRLIRLNLDFADKTFIKLSDELERLESYLTLEKMRFDDNLIYEIWVSDDIDPKKTDIPNMIIQPFVENAIWHGILKLQKTGKVSINIFHSELPDEIRKNYKLQSHASLNGKLAAIELNPLHCIKIEIIDNGIGINKCQTTKTSGHISRGVSVIKERLSILHHYSGETELVKITDRSELSNSESGTIVEIFLTPNIFKVNGAE